MNKTRLYFHRVAEGHRHHRNSDGSAAAAIECFEEQSLAKATCSNNLEQINPGVHAYADDHDTVLALVGANYSPTVWTDYRSWMQRYVGLKGVSSPQDSLFAVVGYF